ncbi:ABC transporter substrate-binding protein [Brevibacillus sp. NRS-1366]|uniref:SgrR family transcriptional regulator n=1 Tax=Brevibacillus sp. NRS-1366 TaxID=3233899 RepID=UPI003D195039
MQLVEQYMRLCAGCAKGSLGQPQEIALAEVAAILFCTLRNATLTVKKMQSQGWLIWQPGRGRGNRSVLTCVLAPVDLILSVAKEMVQKGDIRTSRELIEQYQDEWPALAEDFSRWMSSQFGLHVTREKGNSRVDTLRLFFDRPFHGLDPIHVLLRSQTHLAKHLFDCLVRFDPVAKRIEPHLSFYWDSNDSGTEWTFFLRKGVMFHHGRVLTANDVCYSLQRLKEKQSKHRWLTASIKSIIAREEHIVVITLDEPDPFFLHALSKEYVGIVPHDYVEEMGEQFAQMPVGTGPFRVVRNDDSMIVLEAFQPYFGGRPFLDRIEIWCVPELPEGAKMNHSADPTQLLLAVTSAWRKPEPNEISWQGFTGQEQCFQYVSLNGAKVGPLRDPAFRKMLSGIISPVELRKDLKGTRERAVVWGESGPFRERDEKSDHLAVTMHLQACGYKGETLLLYTYPDLDHVEDAEWIKEKCGQFGINIEIVYADPEELAKPALLEAADLVVDSANVDERSELSLREFLHADALSISHHLPSDQKAALNRLVRKMGLAKTRRERQGYMASIMELLGDMYAFVPLYSNRVEMLAHPRLSGVSLDAYGWIDFFRVFVRA